MSALSVLSSKEFTLVLRKIILFTLIASRIRELARENIFITSLKINEFYRREVVILSGNLTLIVSNEKAFAFIDISNSYFIKETVSESFNFIIDMVLYLSLTRSFSDLLDGFNDDFISPMLLFGRDSSLLRSVSNNLSVYSDRFLIP